MSVRSVFFLLMMVAIIAPAYAKDIGLCSCFKPDYDGSCCIPAEGSMYGNVCRTKDWGDSVKKYEACCAQINGRVKCKQGIAD
ncbi:uncharacterized protein VTP21DRAFT_3564 [Calcarisporiella thermophila]|uniref:uncharacterized protein n=1 Tax=Calcarisporiella thermophila TaxID=911321 RepID=UPI003743CF15